MRLEAQLAALPVAGGAISADFLRGICDFCLSLERCLFVASDPWER
jgi:hypothetical protein